MRKIILALVCMFFAAGCGVRYVVPDATGSSPSKIVVSGYTTDGCRENLNEEASRIGVQVRLTDVKGELGWGILLWPLYKSVTCTGEVIKK